MIEYANEVAQEGRVAAHSLSAGLLRAAGTGEIGPPVRQPDARLSHPISRHHGQRSRSGLPSCSPRIRTSGRRRERIQACEGLSASIQLGRQRWLPAT